MEKQRSSWPWPIWVGVLAIALGIASYVAQVGTPIWFVIGVPFLLAGVIVKAVREKA